MPSMGVNARCTSIRLGQHRAKCEKKGARSQMVKQAQKNRGDIGTGEKETKESRNAEPWTWRGSSAGQSMLKKGHP